MRNSLFIFKSQVIGFSVCLLEIEISISVVIGNILDHLVDEFHLALRQLSVLDILSEEVAEDSAEILVTRI